jgi:hypothetical protein
VSILAACAWAQRVHLVGDNRLAEAIFPNQLLALFGKDVVWVAKEVVAQAALDDFHISAYRGRGAVQTATRFRLPASVALYSGT